MLIKENQFGFRQNYSTIDNIFTLFSFFQIIKLKKGKLCCAFIDFEKAFDKVWREGLFYKMMLNKINGKMYNECQRHIKTMKKEKGQVFPLSDSICTIKVF
jgi:hypothetical protein